MPPPRPLFVHEIIPKAVERLQQHQERILALTGEGAPIVQPELEHALDLCKQILNGPRTAETRQLDEGA